jgi:hypothetical protein
MKVTNDDIIRNAATQAARRGEKVDAGKFDALLRKTVEEKVASGKASVQNLSTIQGPSPIDTASLLGVETSQIVEGTERLLSTLEEFQAKLGDTTIPLDDLSPIVQKMNQQKDLLVPSLDTLPESDPLRDIVNKVLITCSVESEKFERGDYL